MPRIASLVLIASLASITLTPGCAGAGAGVVVAIPVFGGAIGYGVGHARNHDAMSLVGDVLLGFLAGGLVDVGIGYLALSSGANSD